MGQHGKKFRNASAKVDRTKRYSIDEACKLVPETKVAKFDESVDIAVRLGVDPKHADQMVRGAVVLPHGTGKSQRVVVVAKGDKANEAKAAGLATAKKPGSGSKEPNKVTVGKISQKQLRDIATTKMPDLNTTDVEAAMRSIAGTARSMGIEVEGLK